MARTATNLPKDEQAIYDRNAAAKKRLENLSEKGDKATEKEKAEIANLKTQIAADSATLKKMSYKRNLQTSLDAFIVAAKRLRARAGQHSEAQRDVVQAIINEHSQVAHDAFNIMGQAAPKAESVQLPD